VILLSEGAVVAAVAVIGIMMTTRAMNKARGTNKFLIGIILDFQ
jgi:hypothetical protein